MTRKKHEDEPLDETVEVPVEPTPEDVPAALPETPAQTHAVNIPSRTPPIPHQMSVTDRLDRLERAVFGDKTE